MVFKFESVFVMIKLKFLSVGDNQLKNVRDLEVRVKGLIIFIKIFDWLLSNYLCVLRFVVKFVGK